MKTTIAAIACILGAAAPPAAAAAADRVIWQEAESMDETGTWSNDPQHMDIMGSPYLLATGLGTPVEDAVAQCTVARKGVYRLWVRCRDWLPEHSPGRFRVLVDGTAAKTVFGKSDDDTWKWVRGGTFALAAGTVEVRLRDLTGWWGRCDAMDGVRGRNTVNYFKIMICNDLRSIYGP